MTRKEERSVESKHRVLRYQFVKRPGTLGEQWKKFVLLENKRDDTDSISVKNILKKRKAIGQNNRSEIKADEIQWGFGMGHCHYLNRRAEIF